MGCWGFAGLMAREHCDQCGNVMWCIVDGLPDSQVRWTAMFEKVRGTPAYSCVQPSSFRSAPLTYP